MCSRTRAIARTRRCACAHSFRPMSTKPHPEQFRSRAEYRWARKLWLRKHGGSLAGTLAIAVLFGVLSGSAVALILLVLVALVGTVYARSRP